MHCAINPRTKIEEVRTNILATYRSHFCVSLFDKELSKIKPTKVIYCIIHHFIYQALFEKLLDCFLCMIIQSDTFKVNSSNLFEYKAFKVIYCLLHPFVYQS